MTKDTIMTKDVQEILNFFSTTKEELKAKYYNKDENGFVYFVQLTNGDYISNNHFKKPFRYNYAPKLWD